jgi:hypothetical protein
MKICTPWNHAYGKYPPLGWINTKGIMYNCKGGHVMNPNPFMNLTIIEMLVVCKLPSLLNWFIKGNERYTTCKQCFDTDKNVNTHSVYTPWNLHICFLGFNCDVIVKNILHNIYYKVTISWQLSTHFYTCIWHDTKKVGWNKNLPP